jgi:hypothetical protein
LELVEEEDEARVSGQLGERLFQHRSPAELVGQVLGVRERLARKLEELLGRNLAAAHSPADVPGETQPSREKEGTLGAGGKLREPRCDDDERFLDHVVDVGRWDADAGEVPSEAPTAALGDTPQAIVATLEPFSRRRLTVATGRR